MCLILVKKTKEFHMGCMTTRHNALFLCPLTLSAPYNGAYRHLDVVTSIEN